MSAVTLLRNYLELVLAATGVGAALKSAYNGIIRDRILRRLYLAEEAHEKTMRMEEKLDEIDKKLDQINEDNKRTIDYMVALGRAANEDDVDFDVSALREEHDRDGASEFLQDDD